MCVRYSKYYTFQCMCVLVKRVSIFVVVEEFPTLHRPYFFLVPAFFPAPKTLLTFLHPSIRHLETLLLHLNFLDWIITLLLFIFINNLQSFDETFNYTSKLVSLIRDFKHRINFFCSSNFIKEPSRKLQCKFLFIIIANFSKAKRHHNFFTCYMRLLRN